MRILVIGATGTIGEAVVDALSPQHDIIAATTLNAGLEGFVGAAALDMPRGQHISAVSPPPVREAMEKMGWGKGGVPAADVAQLYVRSLTPEYNGAAIVIHQAVQSLTR